MRHIGRRAAVITVTAIFGLGLLGTAALAAFAPLPADTSASLVPPLPGAAQAEAPKPPSHLRDVLDGLVARGVITQQQEDAILAAMNDRSADKQREELLRKVLAGLFNESATYLGMQPADLKAKLPGTSLAAIANSTAGKTRDGLVADLVSFANSAIDKAVGDGKITADQAAKAKAVVPDRVAKFVDHTWPQPKPRLPNVKAFVGDVMSTARDYIGISQKDLTTQLRAGKSLGEIAAANGKTRDGLVAALTASANAKIDKAVADKKLTTDQAAQLKSKVATEIGAIVDKHSKTPAVKSH